MKKVERFDAEIYRRATLCIAHGALTNSKRPESFVKGVYPTHVTRGEGPYVWDTKGNRYIDFICGLGTNLLGYGDEDVTSAAYKALQDGVSLSLPSTLEVDYAERIRSLFPHMEKIRILKTGTEACMASIRIARTYTGKHAIFSEGYHGWSDEFVSLTPPANGVIAQKLYMQPLGKEFPLGAAAVIVEPIITELSEARIQWLRELRRHTQLNQILLIFDETITGLRFPGLSFANYSGISPDISIMGKALANGLPISVVGGKSHVMDSDYFVSSTFSGDRVTLSSSLKVLDLLRDKFDIQRLWDRGQILLNGFNSLWPEGLKLQGYPTRSVLSGSPETKALFMQETCKAGILIGPSFFFNFGHIELIDEVLSTFKDILMRIRLGQVKLEGDMPMQPFAQKQREAA